MWLWMVSITVALAGGGPKLGVLTIPVTPSAEKDTYHALAAASGATSDPWVSDVPGFVCAPAAEYVELSLSRAQWPSALPKKVMCTSGKRKAKFTVDIQDPLDKAMFVSDGRLVLPRKPTATSVYTGPPTRPDVGVQQGKSDSLGLECRIEAGPRMIVSAPARVPDGHGRCSFRSLQGEVFWLDAMVVTHK